jgi:hypothetical protein
MAHFNDEEAYDALAPGVEEAIARMPASLFSTKAVIEQLRAVEAGAAAYEKALQVLAEEGANDHTARLVVHGQVIPGLLRRSSKVRFGGFIHGDPSQDDGYAVPSWWQRVP